MTDIASQPSAMDAIGDAYWEEALRLNPTSATVYGDERFNHLLPDPSATGRNAEIEAVRRASDAANALPDGDLSNEDRITRAIFAVLAELADEDEALHAYEVREVDQIYGPQTVLPQVATFQRADTPALLEAWLERLRAYGPYIDAHIEVLHEGRASGRTAARIVAERTIDQVRRLVDTPLDEAVIPGLSKVAYGRGPRARPRGRSGRRLPGGPALPRGALGRVPRGDAREPGIVSAPGGEGLYRHFIRRWTTLDLDPRDVHQVGLDEYADIDEERRAIARGAGFGDDVEAYRRSLMADPANHAPTVEALLEHVTQAIDRAGAIAPQVFGRCRARPASSSPSSRSRRRTRRPRTTTRRPSTARGPARTTSTPSTSTGWRSTSSRRTRSTRRSPATTSRSAWRWSTRSWACSGAWGRAP